jgi:nitroreductase
MATLSSEQLINALNWRYATKKFDATKKIDQKTWNALEDTLVLTPSSYGLQPWKFLVITDKSVMQKLTTLSWGQKQVEDCSHLVVISIKEKMDEEHVNHFLKETAQTRGIPAESLDGYKKMMIGDVVNGPRGKVSFEWAARQAYIALGNFMTSAALLGIDTCPMEGIDPIKYDDVLGLTNSGWRTVVACPAGFRSTDDKYSEAKKVRFSRAEIIQHI